MGNYKSVMLKDGILSYVEKASKKKNHLIRIYYFVHGILFAMNHHQMMMMKSIMMMRRKTMIQVQTNIWRVLWAPHYGEH